MATDVERLTISLEANLKKYEREMARSRQVTANALNQIEREVTSRGQSISNRFGHIGTAASAAMSKAFAGIAAGVSLNEVRKLTDEFQKIMNSLRVAGVGEADLAKTFDAIFQSAQRNSAPLAALAELYGRVSQAQTTLKVSSGDLLKFTETVAQALRVSGKSATEASGALLQLGQSLSGGKIQAEEYNSLIDGMYPLLQAAAAGLKEAGGDVSKLTALVKDGEVSSQAFFRAIQAGSGILSDKLANAADTSEQALTRLKNETIRFAGEFDKATGISNAFTGAINAAASAIGMLASAIPATIEQIAKLINAMGQLKASSQGAFYQPKTQEDLDALKSRAGDIRKEIDGIRSRTHPSRSGEFNPDIDRLSRELQELENRVGAGLAKPTPSSAPQGPPMPASLGTSTLGSVSIKDHPVAGDDKKGGGGGGKSSADKTDEFQREMQQFEKRRLALENEAKTVGMGTFEIERSRVAHELERAAKEAGIPVTEELRQKIEESASGYAHAATNVEKLEAAQKNLNSTQKFFGNVAIDAFEDLILNAEKAEDVIKNLTKSLAKAALQAALMGTGPLGSVSGIPASAEPQKPQPASPERIAA